MRKVDISLTGYSSEKVLGKKFCPIICFDKIFYALFFMPYNLKTHLSAKRVHIGKKMENCFNPLTPDSDGSIPNPRNLRHPRFRQ